MEPDANFPVHWVLLFSITAVSGFLLIYCLIAMRKHRQAVPGALIQDIINSESPYLRVADLILSHSVEKGADSVILEQKENELIVSNRFEDRVEEMMRPPIHLKPMLTASLKYKAGLDYTKTEPVRGTFFYEHIGKKYELELLNSYTDFGEKVEITIKAG